MIKTEYVLFVIAIVLVIYYFYYYNKSENLPSTIDQSELNNQTLQSVGSEKQSSKPTIGVYYTNWCGYSREFIQQFNNDEQNKVRNAGAEVKLIDCEKDNGPELCKKYDVQGFPTILLHSSQNSDPILYNGNRNGDDIAKFVKSNL